MLVYVALSGLGACRRLACATCCAVRLSPGHGSSVFSFRCSVAVWRSGGEVSARMSLHPVPRPLRLLPPFFAPHGAPSARKVYGLRSPPPLSGADAQHGHFAGIGLPSDLIGSFSERRRPPCLCGDLSPPGGTHSLSGSANAVMPGHMLLAHITAPV